MNFLTNMKYGTAKICTKCNVELKRTNNSIEELKAERYGYCPKCQLKIYEQTITN